jgi:GTP cyclohydrolase I
MARTPVKLNDVQKITPEARTTAVAYMREVLVMLGIDADQPHMLDTPKRYIASLIEQLDDDPWELTTFPQDLSLPGGKGDPGMIVQCNIPFHSLCAHHLSPFFGHAHIAYLPDQQLVGLSKLARLIQSFAAGLQVQEDIGSRAADFFMEHVQPLGIMIVLKANHTCYTLRGVEAHGATTTTSTVRGVFFDDARAREEALTIMRGL